MSAANNLDKAQTVQESETKDTVTETIAYARRTYQGNNPDVKTLQPEKYVFVLIHLHVWY
jgi:hypothetical protein